MAQIQGVKKIESRTIRSFRVELEPRYTNGHDFCELIVDEGNNNFTARLYGGETYSYGWSSPGNDFIKFLIRVFSKGYDYLLSKLENPSFYNFIDTEKTGRNLRVIILTARKESRLTQDEARDLWDCIEILEGHDDLTNSHFYNIYSTYFEAAIKNGVISDEPWFEDFIERKEDWKCRVFCEKVAPILAEVLKQEYAKAY
ncbi:hypothetical protein MHH70_12435 [Metasolibacillus sp. FSL H7-0170]|uniref:hypothetical protein n=1 Tax=Metasolibacillus sp. FSL H7-0170 TaxID=2921431 RepID=UPI0031585776